jgi:hypothetical protein
MGFRDQFAQQQSLAAHIRFGSKADIARPVHHPVGGGRLRDAETKNTGISLGYVQKTAQRLHKKR